MRIKSDYLNAIEIRWIRAAEQETARVLIVSGVHGNEPQSMKGTRLLSEYLSNPENELVTEILEGTTVVTVPLINIIGEMADARSCPEEGVEVEFRDSTVIVQDDEKGMYKFPSGWCDANAGWDTNGTLVKEHIARLIEMIAPTLIIFNHDWTLTQGKIYAYGPEVYDIPDIEMILKCFYPTSNILGIEWKFIDIIGPDFLNFTLPFILANELGIPVLLTEVCVGEDRSPEITLAVNLFILAMYSGAQIGDETVVNRILRSLNHDGKWWTR